jgi:poly(3-hydroxybutyrate) depolymerase
MTTSSQPRSPLLMKNRVAVALGLTLTAGSLSCSSGDSHGDGRDGAQAGGNQGFGGIGSGGTGTSGGPSGSGGAAAGGVATGVPGTGGQSGGAAGGTSGGSAGAGSGGVGTAGAGGSGASGGGGNGGSMGTGGSSGAVSSAGCGRTPVLTSGKHTITSGGQSRSFIIRIPDSYDNKLPHRLVFAYHWLGGTEEDVDGGGSSGFTWSYYGMREQAGSSTIFVAPQGISNGWGNGNNSDVIFTDDMLNQIAGDLCVDTARVFAMGFSYGGGMSKALGCQRPKVFRAVAVYSGADFLSGGCDGSTTSPIAYIGLHSIHDGTNDFTSGVAIRDRFVRNDGCMPQTPPGPVGLTHVCTTYQGCKSGFPVEWCEFDGGGHTPAPVDGSTSGSGGGDKTWTKAEVWKFFTQF